MKQGLLNKISELGKELPLNTLDELIDKFGGPDKVSEVRVQDTELETLWLQQSFRGRPTKTFSIQWSFESTLRLQMLLKL